MPVEIRLRERMRSRGYDCAGGRLNGVGGLGVLRSEGCLRVFCPRTFSILAVVIVQHQQIISNYHSLLRLNSSPPALPLYTPRVQHLLADARANGAPSSRSSPSTIGQPCGFVLGDPPLQGTNIHILPLTHCIRVPRPLQTVINLDSLLRL